MGNWLSTMLLPGVIAVNDPRYSDPTFFDAAKGDLASGTAVPVGAGTYYQAPLGSLAGHMGRAWKQRGLLTAQLQGSVQVGSPFLCKSGSGGLTDPISFNITSTISEPTEISYGLWHTLPPGANRADAIGRSYAFSNAPVAQFLLNPDSIFSMPGCNSSGNCATAAVGASASLDWLMPFPFILRPGFPNQVVSSVGTISGVTGTSAPVQYNVDCAFYVASYANGACPVISGGNHYLIFYVGLAALLIINSGDTTAGYSPDVANGFGDSGFAPHSDGCPSGPYGQICGAAQAETHYDPSISPFDDVSINAIESDDASFAAPLANTDPTADLSIPAGVGGGGPSVLQWSIAKATFASPARFTGPSPI